MSICKNEDANVNVTMNAQSMKHLLTLRCRYSNMMCYQNTVEQENKMLKVKLKTCPKDYYLRYILKPYNFIQYFNCRIRVHKIEKKLSLIY